MNDCFDMDNTQWLKAFVVVVLIGGFVLMAFLPSFGLKAVDPGVLQTVQSVVMLIVGFFFGSSSSSSKKDDVIAAQAAAK